MDGKVETKCLLLEFSLQVTQWKAAREILKIKSMIIEQTENKQETP